MSRFLRALIGAAVLALALPAAALAGVSTTNKPSITGTAKVGDTLTCSTLAANKWTSDDGGTPAFDELDWYYTTDENNPISESFNQSDNTYQVQTGDVGKQIVCKQTDIDEGNGDFSSGTSPASTPTVAVAPGDPPTTTGKSKISGTPQAGSDLFCQGPQWTPSGGQFDFVDTTDNWYYSTDTSTPLPNGSNTSDYTVQPGDVNHQIECIETATDEQTGGTATSASDPVAIVPTASVKLTQYSPSVSGDIGEKVAGVSVKLTLERATGDPNHPLTPVASASVTTDANGFWSTSLTPSAAPNDALAANGDELVVQYAAGTSPSGTILPGNSTYNESGVNFAGDQSTISSNGKTVTADVGDCANLTFVVDGTSHATTNSNFDCVYSPATALTDNNHVQAVLNETYTDDQTNTDSALTTVSDVGLLGVGFGAGQGAGAPTCSADLVTGFVSCGDLNGAAFTISNGTSSAPLTVTPNATTPGWVDNDGSAFLSGVAPGQSITLKETGGSRILTTLHTANLQVAYGLDGTVSGTCQPNKEFGAGGADGICPTTGTFTNGQAQTYDDLSGGSTVVDVPSLSGLIPSGLDSIAGGTFTSYGDVSNIGTTAQILAATKTVALAIIPHAGGAAVFSKDMTLTSDALGPFADVGVTGIAQGRFFADWKLTDSHGDTRVYSNEFAVQPADTGPAGPAGAQGAPGAQGPAGKDGSSSLTKCTTKKSGKGKHKKSHTTCSTTVVAPGSHTVSVAITRGKRTVAAGSAVVRSGIAHVTVRHAGALRHGRYLVTVLAGSGSKTTVTRRYEHL